jgi:hypothetical protein
MQRDSNKQCSSASALIATNIPALRSHKDADIILMHHAHARHNSTCQEALGCQEAVCVPHYPTQSLINYGKKSSAAPSLGRDTLNLAAAPRRRRFHALAATLPRTATAVRQLPSSTTVLRRRVTLALLTTWQPRTAPACLHTRCSTWRALQAR